MSNQRYLLWHSFCICSILCLHITKFEIQKRVTMTVTLIITMVQGRRSQFAVYSQLAWSTLIDGVHYWTHQSLKRERERSSEGGTSRRKLWGKQETCNGRFAFSKYGVPKTGQWWVYFHCRFRSHYDDDETSAFALVSKDSWPSSSSFVFYYFKKVDVPFLL